MKKHYIIPVFVPHLGCPNDCVFCNQKSISGEQRMITNEDIKKTIDFYLENIKDKDAKKEVAFFGGSFTGIDVDKQEEFLQTAYNYIKENKIDSIRISTRPDYIDRETLKRLKKYKVKTIELGVQSANDYILKQSNRGHNFQDVKKASKLIRRYRFNLGHQMMVGLPESTRLDEINTAKELIKLKPQIVRIYPVLVIKGTELEEQMEKGEYTPPLPPSRGGRGHEEDPFSVFAGENKDLLKAFREFEKMRNKIKKPLTNRAKELTISDLKKLSGNPAEWIAILDQSVQRSYQGVFALKTEYQGRQRVPAGSAGTSPLGNMEREALARMLGGQNGEEETG